MKKIIFNTVPKSIQKKILNSIRSLLRVHWERLSSEIPKYELKEEQLLNTKLLANRQDLLKLMPKNATVAELGVDQGGFSEMILRICSPAKLHLIDFWGSERYNQKKRKLVEKKFSQQIDEKKLEINLGLSTEVVHQFKDNYFDWIYIDTDHSYKTTLSELEYYKNKMKKNGIIAGHDYILGNWNGMVRYGVIEAVYEFCNKHDWEILYLTTEINIPPSFAICKRDVSKTSS